MAIKDIPHADTFEFVIQRTKRVIFEDGGVVGDGAGLDFLGGFDALDKGALGGLGTRHQIQQSLQIFQTEFEIIGGILDVLAIHHGLKNLTGLIQYSQARLAQAKALGGRAEFKPAATFFDKFPAAGRDERFVQEFDPASGQCRISAAVQILAIGINCRAIFEKLSLQGLGEYQKLTRRGIYECVNLHGNLLDFPQIWFRRSPSFNLRYGKIYGSRRRARFAPFHVNRDRTKPHQIKRAPRDIDVVRLDSVALVEAHVGAKT